MIERRLTCILCPTGCELTARFDGPPRAATIVIDGEGCPRGFEYAVEELVAPRRTLTTSVRVNGGVERLASVRTTKPIPLAEVATARERLRRVVLRAPVEIGDVVVRDLPSPGVDVIVTRAVARKSSA